jgi:hypothetical protein
LAERAFAARGGVLYELFALLLPQDVIGIKPRVDRYPGGGPDSRDSFFFALMEDMNSGQIIYVTVY